MSNEQKPNGHEHTNLKRIKIEINEQASSKLPCVVNCKGMLYISHICCAYNFTDNYLLLASGYAAGLFKPKSNEYIFIYLYCRGQRRQTIC